MTDYINNNYIVKSLPLFLIDIVFNNIMNNDDYSFSGILLNSFEVKVKDKGKEFISHLVIKDSSQFINGKKKFTINVDHLIHTIDNKKFNVNGLLYSDILNMYVPLNTYFMLKSDNEVSINYTKFNIELNENGGL